MKIYIDADGSPVLKETTYLAKKYNVPLVIVKNYAHFIESDYGEVITVDIEKDSADLYIANKLKKDDLLITQDYALGALALAKESIVITQDGLVISDFNIDTLLLNRHLNQKLRSEKKFYSKKKKRTQKNDDTFSKALENILIKKLS